MLRAGYFWKKMSNNMQIETMENKDEATFKTFHYTDSAKSAKIACGCGWNGLRKESLEVWSDTRASQSGWCGMEFYCPKCEKRVDAISMIT